NRTAFVATKAVLFSFSKESEVRHLDAILCKEVTKGFKESRWWPPGSGRVTLAVRAVSLQVPRGEIFGVLGPNGSGKSTLIRMLATLLIPDSGEIRIFGHDVDREARTVRSLLNRVSVEASFFKK